MLEINAEEREECKKQALALLSLADDEYRATMEHDLAKARRESGWWLCRRYNREDQLLVTSPKQKMNERLNEENPDSKKQLRALYFCYALLRRRV